MRPLLLIKTGGTLGPIAAERGDFEHWFAAGLAGDGARPEPPLILVDVQSGGALPPLDAVSGAVITGSPAMVSAREPWSEATAAWLARALERDLPLLGVCYGHQLLAHAAGGEVGPNPRGLEMGTVAVTFTPQAADDPLLGGSPDPLPAQATHHEAVLALPPGARLLGHTPRDPHHAFALDPSAWGVQFHPEFDAEIMKGYLNLRRDALVADGQDPEALIAAVQQTPGATALLHRFAALVRQNEAAGAT